MSQFHKPRPSSAIIYALLCIKYSFASPVLELPRQPFSFVTAHEPVHIISPSDLPSDFHLSQGHGTTTDDGTTVTTTFNVPRDLVRRRTRLTLEGASEPVHIIPTEDLPPDFHPAQESSTTTNDGTTLTTTYNVPRDLVRRRRRLTLEGASEPVHIIPTEDLPPDFHSPSGSSTTKNDGTTLTTTYNVPRDPIQERQNRLIVSATEPVHIIPIEDLPSEFRPPQESSTTTDDGTTVTTTYNVPRDLIQERQNIPIVSASEPVHIIPNDQLPPGLKTGGGIANITNDGTTVTTTFTPSIKVQEGKQSNITSSLNLVKVTNESLGVSELGMGLNCQGSKVMCIGSSQMGVMHTLRDYMYAIPDGYSYYTGQKIACMKHEVYPNPWITWGFYCAFMQGNISPSGVDGAVIQLKMQQMIEHNCLGCGSVPISDDNDPNVSGILTVNYVRQSECEGLCYYVPPGIQPSSVKVPQHMTLVQ